VYIQLEVTGSGPPSQMSNIMQLE